LGVTAASNYSVSDVEMMSKYTNLAFNVARMVSKSNPGGYMISFDSFANYSFSLEDKAINMNVLIPERYSSLKILFAIVRDSNNLSAYTKKTLSTRLYCFGKTDNAHW
jgi:hypothetical protein